MHIDPDRGVLQRHDMQRHLQLPVLGGWRHLQGQRDVLLPESLLHINESSLHAVVEDQLRPLLSVRLPRWHESFRLSRCAFQRRVLPPGLPGTSVVDLRSDEVR